MVVTTDLDAYRHDPIGKAVVGRRFVHVCGDAETFATFLWGRPDVEDAAALVDVIRVEMGPSIGPHVSLADLRFLTQVDEAAFELLTAYFASVRAASARQIRKQAVVFGSGLVGTIAAGYFVAFQAPFPVQAFPTLEDAADWLGVPAASARAWDGLRDRAAACPPELTALRVWVSSNLATATLGAAAAALGVSARTLQRKLSSAGTSFHKERDDARLAFATATLRNANEKLSPLALALGFASHQHFTDWFRARTGDSPSAYRARDR